MFTGLIRDLGRLVKSHPSKNGICLSIESQLPAACFEIGQSIAVNGVCLTVESYKENIFTVTAVQETLSKTQLQQIKVGDQVNLEAPLTLETPLGGHMVSGHVDTIGIVKSLPPNLVVSLPKEFHKFIAPKGSITLNGVSLTVVDSQAGSLSVALIPETLKKTNLGQLKIGDSLNIEVDLLARYLNHLIQSQ